MPGKLVWPAIAFLVFAQSACSGGPSGYLRERSYSNYRAPSSYPSSTTCYNYGGGTIQCDTWDPALGRSRSTYCITMPSGTVYCSHSP